MNCGLKYVFIVKIVLTVLFWCIPILFFPVSWFASMGYPTLEPIVFVRLVGMAYTALVVGYCFGLAAILRGEYPAGPVWAGIVSNGGAAAILAIYGFSGQWQSWGISARYSMWGSLVIVLAITLGLLICRKCDRHIP